MRCGLTLSLATAFSLLLIGEAVGSDAVLHGTVFDGITGRQIPCTVTITDANGKVAVESDSFRNGFRCSGEFTKRLPAGPTRIQITRGLETRAINRRVNLVAGEKTDLAFTLERVVNLRNRGWFAGDSHVHMLHGERTVPVSFDYVALAARAEDLQFMCLAQAWNIDQPTPERLEAELRGRSTPDCVLTWNLEAPKNYYKGDAGRCLGHCWNLGVRGRTPAGQDVIRLLMAASAWDYESTKPTYANFESHQLIHDQGGVACYSHPARWWMGAWGGQGGYPKVDRMRVSNLAVELPLDTLLGPTYDGLDLITGPGEFEANAKAFADLVPIAESRVSDRGDRVLRCLLRSAWGRHAGHAAHLCTCPRQILAGKGNQAIAAGRTFVTTGPLLIASLDGNPPGSQFPSGAKARALSVEAWASGRSSGGLDASRSCGTEGLARIHARSQARLVQTNFNILEQRDLLVLCARVRPGQANRYQRRVLFCG